MHRAAVLASVVIALLPLACTSGDTDGDASPPADGGSTPDDGTTAEAPTGETTGARPGAPAERPDTVRGTILLEGMADSMTFILYESPAAFPVPFSTYVPEDMAVEADGSGGEDRVRFVAEFGGVRNEDAYLEASFLPAGTAEADARERARLFAERRGIRQRDPEVGKRYPWSLVEYHFMERRRGGVVIVGTIALGRHNARYFDIVLHYPVAFGDGFGPRAAQILDAWRWEDGGRLGASAGPTSQDPAGASGVD